MNKFIIEQLKKCKVARVPQYTDNTTMIYIPFQGVNSNDILMQKNKYYIIKVNKAKITDTVMINWNKNINIVSDYLMVTFIKSLSNMRCFDGCGYNIVDKCALNDIYYNIWLPNNSFEIIDELGE